MNWISRKFGNSDLATGDFLGDCTQLMIVAVCKTTIIAWPSVLRDGRIDDNIWEAEGGWLCLTMINGAIDKEIFRHMTAKSSSNKVPASTLYRFIASGFWRYKCFGNKKIFLSQCQSFFSCYPRMFHDPNHISVLVFRRNLDQYSKWNPGGKLRKSSTGNKSVRDFPVLPFS